MFSSGPDMTIVPCSHKPTRAMRQTYGRGFSVGQAVEGARSMHESYPLASSLCLTLMAF
jgi:hypothetical protein